MTSGWRRAVLFCLCGWLATACDPDSTTAGIDRGGVRIVAEGPITGFGSIIVHNVHYDIARATISIDGSVASGSDLQLGQVVTVVGERDANGTSGVADSVLFQTNVRGPVQADGAAGTLTVLRQRVVAAAGTVIIAGTDPPVVASFAIGDSVEVSGFRAADGLIAATRIARAAPNRSLRIFGTVSNLDTSRLRFNIYDLVVDYSAALVIDGFPNGQPMNGDQVVVQGTALGANGELLARELEREEEESSGGSGHETEVEGLITRFVSPLDFDVARRRATTQASTIYAGGSASSLALNVKVELEGTTDDNGVIVAKHIEIETGP